MTPAELRAKPWLAFVECTEPKAVLPLYLAMRSMLPDDEQDACDMEAVIVLLDRGVNVEDIDTMLKKHGRIATPDPAGHLKRFQSRLARFELEDLAFKTGRDLGANPSKLQWAQDGLVRMAIAGKFDPISIIACLYDGLDCASMEKMIER